MTKSRGIMAPRHVWTPEQLAVMRLHYPDQSAQTVADLLGLTLKKVYACAKRLGIRKSAEFYSSGAANLFEKGTRVGSQTWFRPGHQPWAKGLKGVHLNPATEFKKGCVPKNTAEVGALRINSMGDIDIKVAPGPRQWVSLRRYVWEQANGPIPPRMCIGTVNGDPHDTQLHNLLLMTRQENVLHNYVRRYPKPLRVLMQTGGRLKAQIQKTQQGALHG